MRSSRKHHDQMGRIGGRWQQEMAALQVEDLAHDRSRTLEEVGFWAELSRRLLISGTGLVVVAALMLISGPDWVLAQQTSIPLAGLGILLVGGGAFSYGRVVRCRQQAGQLAHQIRQISDQLSSRAVIVPLGSTEEEER